MTEILRVKMRWQNYLGAPGYSIFHFRDFESTGDQNGFAQGAVDKVQAFATSVRTLIPYQAQLQVLGEVEVIEDTTGDMVDVIGLAQPAVQASTGTASDNFAAAVGGVISWRTSSVHRGRRVKGRTFLVPLNGTQFENNGTLRSTAIDAMNTAATALRSATGTPDLGIYCRPSAPGASDGAWYAVTSHSVPDMGAVLRSRRD